MSAAWPETTRILISYAYLKPKSDELSQYRGVDLLIDSGAFTAFTLGKKINIGEYMDYLVEHRSLIGHAAALDVIGDWRGSAKNFEIMQSKIGDKVKILPAWHLGSPISELERLCRENDYMAIGGCVPYAKQPKVLMRQLIQAHKVARKHGTGLHGLGITGKTSMTRLPWKSTDSSSWIGGHRYGQLSLINARGEQISLPFGARLGREETALVRAYGGDPARFQDSGFCLIGKVGKEQGSADRKWVAQSAARSIMHHEGLLRARHGTEFNCYLASAPGAYTDWAVDAHAMGSPFARKLPTVA